MNNMADAIVCTLLLLLLATVGWNNNLFGSNNPTSPTPSIPPTPTPATPVPIMSLSPVTTSPVTLSPNMPGCEVSGLRTVTIEANGLDTENNIPMELECVDPLSPIQVVQLQDDDSNDCVYVNGNTKLECFRDNGVGPTSVLISACCQNSSFLKASTRITYPNGNNENNQQYLVTVRPSPDVVMEFEQLTLNCDDKIVINDMEIQCTMRGVTNLIEVTYQFFNN